MKLTVQVLALGKSLLSKPPPPPFLPIQSLYSGVDDLRDTKVDKELLEVEVREVSHASEKPGLF